MCNNKHLIVNTFFIELLEVSEGPGISTNLKRVVPVLADQLNSQPIPFLRIK